LDAADFFRSVYEDNRDRPRRLRRRPAIDLALYAVNAALVPLERRLVRRRRGARWPIAFIVGPPRAGTTLLYQLLARYLEVGYPSNFTARFWRAPVAAALLERRLRRRPVPLESDYGRTRGAASPHELGWFWRHRLDLGTRDALTPAELARADAGELRDELVALADVFGGPFVWKNVNATAYHARWLHELLPDARFIRIRREPLAVALSILRARRHHYGDPGRWWSIRPRDVDAWRSRPWAEQIAHQIADVEGALTAQSAELPAAAVACLGYEELVADPRGWIRTLAGFLGAAVRDAAALEALELAPRPAPEADPRERDALERALAAQRGDGR
jgi:LPS sulfotransferase NodH